MPTAFLGHGGLVAVVIEVLPHAVSAGLLVGVRRHLQLHVAVVPVRVGRQVEARVGVRLSVELQSNTQSPFNTLAPMMEREESGSFCFVLFFLFEHYADDHSHVV